jgi:hypothetical protein
VYCVVCVGVVCVDVKVVCGQMSLKHQNWNSSFLYHTTPNAPLPTKFLGTYRGGVENLVPPMSTATSSGPAKQKDIQRFKHHCLSVARFTSKEPTSCHGIFHHTITIKQQWVSPHWQSTFCLLILTIDSRSYDHNCDYKAPNTLIVHIIRCASISRAPRKILVFMFSY